MYPGLEQKTSFSTVFMITAEVITLTHATIIKFAKNLEKSSEKLSWRLRCKFRKEIKFLNPPK